MHFAAAAKDVAMIVPFIGIRIFTVTQSVVYQKIFHIHEDMEDSGLIKISLVVH